MFDFECPDLTIPAYIEAWRPLRPLSIALGALNSRRSMFEYDVSDLAQLRSNLIQEDPPTLQSRSFILELTDGGGASAGDVGHIVRGTPKSTFVTVANIVRDFVGPGVVPWPHPGEELGNGVWRL